MSIYMQVQAAHAGRTKGGPADHIVMLKKPRIILM
ncbi:hypothetical protein BMETH_3558_0 [methanotrophic bacterial endosymbiont of Bathymodiolus sp.]|nr:hypothetical protein BMETH_3558_0 [methanotrophic bacterial endosymbiont of Bathymodiolus sp.]